MIHTYHNSTIFSVVMFQGNVHSMNTLGWYAMDVEHNMTKAAMYFDKAYKYGDPDAAHNLGHMHLNGFHPNSKNDSYWLLLVCIHPPLRNVSESSFTLSLV